MSKRLTTDTGITQTTRHQSRDQVSPFTFAALLIIGSMMLTACGGGSGDDDPGPSTTTYTVTTSVGTGGSFDSSSATVDSGSSTSFSITLDTGYRIDSVTGCDGSLTGTTYTTGAITADCTVTASFAINQYTVTATAATGGSFDRASATVNHGETTAFSVAVDNGFRLDAVTGCAGSLSGTTYTTGSVTADCTVNASFIAQYTVTTFASSGGSFDSGSAVVDSGSTTSFEVTADAGFTIGSVSGCDGSLSGSTYTTGSINADCTITANFLISPASAPSPSLSVGMKTLQFSWAAVDNTDHYRILANPDGASGFSVVTGAENIAGLSYDLQVPVHLLDWVAAEYLVEACNANDSVCLSSASQTLTAADSIAATGYFKASNTGAGDLFGRSVSVSGDGNTLAVGANAEESNATGVDGDQGNDGASFSGAVYIFTRDGGSWSQQAYLKASNSEAGDEFGRSLSLSNDGNTLAVGAYLEDSNATGIDGAQTDNSENFSGAVYVFTRVGSSWSQQAYVKASNTAGGNGFGFAVSLAHDGNTLAVGANGERSNATGIDGDQTDFSSPGAGAAYVFTRSGSSWSQQAYIKASNSGENDGFGDSLSLSGDGNTLAVGASGEDSNATGIDGNEADNSQVYSGAVYVFTRVGGSWSQQAYVKASNTQQYDNFGISISLSNDGDTLAVGASGEDGNGAGNSSVNSGAVYIFTRDGGNWSQQRYIKTNKQSGSPRFGHALNLSGDGTTLAVGAFREDSNATGIEGDSNDASAADAGAVWVYHRYGASWRYPFPVVDSYVKASNTGASDQFGISVSLSDDGQTLAVGAFGEGSNATGIAGDQADNSAASAGAVYVY